MKTLAPPQALFETEWDANFERLRRERMVQGAYRYGKLADRFKMGHNYFKAIEQRLKLYKKTRNLELMLDIGNFAMIVWMKDDHPKCHFQNDPNLVLEEFRKKTR